MKNESNNPSGREQNTSLLIDAPIELVWEVWTKPDHIRNWWGPNGFTSTIEKMEVKNGGEWIFAMHGPDGTHFPNKTIFREVIPYKKLVHEHFSPNFIAIINFHSKGDKTLLTWYKLYETRELYNLVEIQYKASEGLKQTTERLKVYLEQIKSEHHEQ